MNIQAFLDASPAVQIHSAFGVAAFLLGGYLLLRRKGGRWHRLVGRSWIAVMVVVSLTAIFINELRMWGPFSPLHLFVPVTLFSCWLAIRHARARRFTAHAQTVVGLYLGGVIVAGGVTFLPGRLMHEIFLDRTGLGYAAVADWVMHPILFPFIGAVVASVFAGFVNPSLRLRLRKYGATVRENGR